MKISPLALPTPAALAAATLASAVLATTPLMAAEVELTYTGIVSYAGGTTANSGYTDGATISGQLFVNTVTDGVTGATLGSFAAPNGLVAGSANLSSTDAIFQQGAYVGNGDALNNSVSVDLSSATGSYTISDLATFLLQGNGTLNSQIDFTAGAAGQNAYPLYEAGDGFGSSATFLKANGDGTNQTQVAAYLESVTATAVPLPAGAWLMISGTGGLLMGFARRRKLPA